MTASNYELLSAGEWAERAPQLRDQGWVLVDLTGLDRIGLASGDEGHTGRFEIVCTLLNRDARQRKVVHVPAQGDPPTVASVARVWGTAAFAEREVYDMYGVVFDGHGDLTRIFMPDDWEGHPLRKDYDVGKIAIDFKPQPFMQIESPGQSPSSGESGIETDALGQVKRDDRRVQDDE
ncbi:MAG: NADH-quinone oxidoreductase subunit C [Actinomycetota bacterium]